MRIKLSELEGEIWNIAGRPQMGDVLFFVCPLCPKQHGIAVSWEKPSIVDSGAVWKKVSGTTIDDLTLSPSINCDVEKSDCKFHGWIKDGHVEF